MATQKQALAAARKKWGKRAFVRENKHAMTPTQRDDRRAHIATINARIAEIDELRKQNQGKDHWTALLKAAEFCRDVNAQEPSLSQLGEAATESRRWVDLLDERSALKEECRRLSASVHNRRWDAGYVGDIPGLGNYLSCDVSADTLDELLEKIGRERATV